MSATEILEAAKALPQEERIKLAQDFWEIIAEDGYDPDLTPEQAAELDRRLADFEKNPRAGIPWEQIETELLDQRLQDRFDNPKDVVSWEDAKAKLDAKYGK
jgi:putative addiction module component (TIGR02574 family)